MARCFTSLVIVVLLAGVPGFGQIVIGNGGGGYPGGGYPGGRQRYPQNGPGGPQQQGRQSNGMTLIGTLRNIGEKTIVIEDDDKMVTTVAITKVPPSTSTLRAAAKANIGDFQPGDHVNISANQDNNNNYKATTITMVREGTADEHSLASLHTDDTSPLPRSSDSSSSSSNSFVEQFVGNSKSLRAPQAATNLCCAGRRRSSDDSVRAVHRVVHRVPQTITTPTARSCAARVPVRMTA